MKCKKHPPVVKVREGNVIRYKFAEPHRLWGELKERGIRQKTLAKAISIPIVTLNQYLLSYRPMPDSVEQAIVRVVNCGLVEAENPVRPARKTFQCYCDVHLFEVPGATVVCPGCFSAYGEGPKVEGVPATYDSRLQVLLVKEMRDYPAASVGGVVETPAEFMAKPGVSDHPYAKLREVLERAFIQASGGKGKERHAEDGEVFEDQVICEVRRRVGHGYTRGQAVKKIYEAGRLPKDRAVAELLGAINYIAADIIVLEEEA